MCLPLSGVYQDNSFLHKTFGTQIKGENSSDISYDFPILHILNFEITMQQQDDIKVTPPRYPL
jgi:hypothetical protein